jgi:hypothetical protein
VTFALRDRRVRRVRASPVTAACLLALLASSCSFPHGPAPSFPAPLPPPQAATPPPPPEPTTPTQVRDEIARWFLAAGYQRFQVAALIGHARDESGYRPCAAGPAGLRYLYQWGGTRLRRLYEFAGARGCPRLDTQLAFADSELRHDPKFYCFWEATGAAAALAELRRGFGRGSC